MNDKDVSHMQINLPNIDLPYPKRPKENSEDVISRAVSSILPSVLAWVEPGMRLDDSEVEHVKDELIDALTYEYYGDGYDIVKYLDQTYGWDGGAELVDVFEEAFFKRREAYREVVKEWVYSAGVMPRKKVGDSVSFFSGGKKYRGVVSRVDTDHAQYLLFSEEMGHKMPGSFKGSGYTGVYVNYEDVVDE